MAKTNPININGDTITVKVRRGTGEKDIKITLTSAKKD